MSFMVWRHRERFELYRFYRACGYKSTEAYYYACQDEEFLASERPRFVVRLFGPDTWLFWLGMIALGLLFTWRDTEIWWSLPIGLAWSWLTLRH